MVTGDSRQQIIPPTRIHVKAGFVVYSPETGERSIIILDEGELTAIDTADGDRKVVFKMHPGDLVGVASLLEREPFHLTIEASKDSVVTLINEDCMESELKTLPVWLLAVIRALSRKTRKLKASLYAPATSNSLMSLAAYCSNIAGSASGLLIAIAVALFGEQLLSFYTADPEVIRLGRLCLWCDVVLQPFKAANMVITSALRASGDSKFPAIVGSSMMWTCGLGTALLLAFVLDLGLVGIWLGMAADEFYRSIVNYIRWCGGKWKKSGVV